MATMETEKARIAVIGTGWWATWAHVPALQQNPAAELVALCDQDADKVAQTAQTYGVPKTYTDVEALLDGESLDGVIVATNHANHFSVAAAALKRGIHVLLEKPMTLFAPEARDLVNLSNQHGGELIIGYNYNFTPYAIRSRELMQAGKLGAAQYITGIFNQEARSFLSGKPRVQAGPHHSPGDVYSDPLRSGGGHGHLQLTHLIGLLFFVTGLRAERVHSVMRNHGLNVDVVDAFMIEFEGGAIAAIGGTGNNVEEARKIDLQVYCADGWIDIDEAKGTALLQGADVEREEYAPPDGVKYVVPASITTDNLVDVALRRAANGSPGEVGWRAVEVLDAAYRSAAKGGQAVTVESLYE